MDVTIQFESHRVELAAIFEMEHDPQTLESYDQPQAITLDYNSASGQRQVVRHTSDFVVLRHDAAGWEECRTEDELNRLADHNPNRYRQETGCRHCPPGEGYASQFGLYYRLRSSKEIDWRFQRHVLFLRISCTPILALFPPPPKRESFLTYAPCGVIPLPKKS
jgi:putative transposase